MCVVFCAAAAELDDIIQAGRRSACNAPSLLTDWTYHEARMANLSLHPESAARKPVLTAERLRDLLEYDPATGIFRWRIAGRRVNPHEGKEAGAVSRGRVNSIVIRIDCRMYHASRLAWLYVYGEWPRGFVDHKNRDRLDNRIDNLRDATRAQNGWNSTRSRHNTSGHKGVGFVKPTGKWRAIITCNGKAHFLGGFLTKEEAVHAYHAAAELLHGEFARIE